MGYIKVVKKTLKKQNGFSLLLAKATYKIFGNLMIKIYKMTIKRPKDNYIVIESRPDYADNARVLSEYMVENGYTKKYHIFWLVDDPSLYSDFKTHHVRFVRKFGKVHRHRTVRAFYYSLKSRFVIFTHAWRWAEQQTPGQTYINLWHGCGFKDSRGEEGLSNVFDAVMVPGPVFVDTKSRFFGCEPEKVIPIGYPRYDLFKKENPLVDEFLARFPEGNKNVLWMPTFRDTTQLLTYEDPIPFILGLPLMHTIHDFDTLDEICREEKINLLVKWHRNTRGGSGVDKPYTNIFYIENSDLDEAGIQLYEFVAKSDALITDFSSIAIDYLLLNKPIGFTMDDFADYAGTRGFVFEDPKKYMAGEYIENLEDMRKYLHHIAMGEDPTAERRQAILGETQNPTDDYCKRCLDYFGI